jgi:PTS system N-acetylglucosamine-specific IIB component
MADIKAADIIAALGGADNIEEVEGCITRLRVEVEDGDLVDKVIVGPIADNLAQDIQDEL